MWADECKFHTGDGDVCGADPQYLVRFGGCSCFSMLGLTACEGHGACEGHAAEWRSGTGVSIVGRAPLRVVRITALESVAS